MNANTPRALARAAVQHPVLPPGTGDRFAGYGVMGLPFRSGHYLALRDFPASSVGPGYRAVWQRDPQERWTVYADAPPDQSCARYLGPALTAARTAPIGIAWTGDRALTVEVDNLLVWNLEIAATTATRLLSTLGGILPGRALGMTRLLRVMGLGAGPLLGVGRVNLIGRMPAGQPYRAIPRRVWSVVSSSAVLDGVDLGPIGPLREQDSLGDFQLPQRGIFYAEGIAEFGVPSG